MWDGTDDSQAYVDLCAEYAKSGGAPYSPRTRDEIAAVFSGLEFVTPGYTRITEWQPDPNQVGQAPRIAAFGGVARKP